MTIHISDKLIYLGAGCGLGLILGALYSPRAGKEMRRNLRRSIEASGIADTAGEAWNEVVETGKNVASFGRKRLGLGRR